MSIGGKAAFLSYASQDAEATARICAALRAAGVEVWFDQSELVGGDAWDAKIRGQIASCALFVPVISESTQARREGYFRLEWKLAAQRTHMIADGTPFLLPVAIDRTGDAEALVPSEFRAVQWTRLRVREAQDTGAVEGPPPGCGGQARQENIDVALAKFGERVKRLLVGDASMPHASPAPARGVAASARPRLRAAIVGAAVMMAGAAWWLSRSSAGSREHRQSVAPNPEARQLVAKAWQTLDNAPEPSRAELDAAAEYYQRAAALDSTDADVWALGSQIDTWYVAENVDNSAERRESARAKATKALNLSPDSYEARLAQAVYLVRGEGFDTPSSFAAEAEQQLRALLRGQPDEPRALLALGHLLRNSRRVEEASALFDRLALNPAWIATATNAKAWMLYRNARFDEAVVEIARSVEARPFHGNVRLQGSLAMDWQGDLDLAKRAVERMPAADLREDYGAYFAVVVYWYRREPEQMLRVLNAAPREWVSSLSFTGPKDYWVGIAQQMAGNEEAAKLAWQAALRLVEQHLAANASSAELQVLKGRLLVRLGERAAAEKVFALASQLGWRGWPAFELGDAEAVIAHPEPGAGVSWAKLRFSPAMDFLRGNPSFEAYVADAAKDPHRAPRSKRAAPTAAAAGGNTEEKSIAVLAFENLSDDKANEYFSDGIADELLNQLGKVPGLRVAGRMSAFSFKTRNVPDAAIARALGVEYLVNGSVQRAGAQVRITARLNRAADGVQLWSDRFTKELKDVFAVQDEIAGLIAQNLQLKLGYAPRASRSVDPEAHRLTLEGRHWWTLRTDEAFARAEAAYTEALRIDPDFAEAHAGLADVWAVRGWYRSLAGQATAEEFARARQEAQSALRLDDSLAPPHATLGAVAFNEGKFAEAEEAFAAALKLNRNYAYAYHWRAHLRAAQGRIDEAIVDLEMAARLDPLSTVTLAVQAIILEYAGRDETAAAVADRARALTKDFFVPLENTRALVLWKLGRREEAIAAARAVARNWTLQPRWWSDAYALHVLRQAGLEAEARDFAGRLMAGMAKTNGIWASLLVGLGRDEEAIEQLVRASTGRSALTSVFYTAAWADARRLPQFVEAMKNLGCLDDYETARAAVARLKAAKP